MNHSGWCEISCLVTRGLHIGDELLILGGHWYCACILETWRKSHNGFKQGGRNGVFPQPPPFDALLVGGNRARDGSHTLTRPSYMPSHEPCHSRPVGQLQVQRHPPSTLKTRYNHRYTMGVDMYISLALSSGGFRITSTAAPAYTHITTLIEIDMSHVGRVIAYDLKSSHAGTATRPVHACNQASSVDLQMRRILTLCIRSTRVAPGGEY
ncbi:uncharacterized protein LAJ45_09016 [Morchella importuna]|uniref:uncharacterized protein n=1 Tax=Morchella importuna TaxID=1174673 RepID=UPI001E8DE1E0|nr:uncharacterized protein LAJ45_09016 [Morchella importuna]KAH8146936.1 hypothetical protein LAJ45_09016 [Morchella importuna]